MKRTHALLIALALGIAVVAGSFAALRTTQLSSKAVTSSLSAAQYAKQNLALNRAEATLRAELRRRPPSIPALRKLKQPAIAAIPAVAQASSAPGPAHAALSPVAPAAATVIYHRPPPIVHVIHRRGGEHEGDSAHGEGGGLDD